MAYSRVSLLLAQRRSGSQSSGFTLIELLVVVLIAGGIISGLTYLAVELLTSDKRESVRTETQRDLQLTLDYISSELREAIYVYPDVLDPATNEPYGFFPNEDDFGLENVSLEPVLAFWKQQPLPRSVKEDCADSTITEPECSLGHSYSLVVYSMQLPIPGADQVWQGNAQIVRAAMTKFRVEDGESNSGYVPLDGTAAQFENWATSADPTFNQNSVLTDFIDDGAGAVGQTRSGTCPETPGADTVYGISPSQPIAGEIRSFYACITDADNPEAVNQEVIVYLQGNAAGRSGIYGDDGFLPTLESRILSRGVLDDTF
jgi:prepilin-type N-terminal cleavage/methylation domain-containing protein